MKSYQAGQSYTFEVKQIEQDRNGKAYFAVTDGEEEFIVELNRPMMGVYIPKMIWKDMYDFSSDSVLLVLASTHYDGSEYIRDYEEYLKEVRK